MAKQTRLDRSAKIMAWKYARQKMDIDEMSDLVGVVPSILHPWLVRKFRDEAVKLWAPIVRERDGCCQIGNNECSGDLNAHHLLERSAYTHLVIDLNNGITLCESHHVFHPTMSAHRQQDNFIEYLRSISYDLTWYDEHRYDRGLQKVDFEEGYFNLLERTEE